MFAVGGLVAASSDSIWGVIAGRALQGTGAMCPVWSWRCCPILTRESHQTRAMAIIGATVGLSFGVAMVAWPFDCRRCRADRAVPVHITDGAGEPGAGDVWYVPTPVPPVTPSRRRRIVPQMLRVLRHQALFRLDLGVFLLHMVMVAVFVVVPPSLELYEHLPASQHWQDLPAGHSGCRWC
jgi:hypothetical protein